MPRLTQYYEHWPHLPGMVSRTVVCSRCFTNEKWWTLTYDEIVAKYSRYSIPDSLLLDLRLNQDETLRKSLFPYIAVFFRLESYEAVKDMETDKSLPK